MIPLHYVAKIAAKVAPHAVELLIHRGVEAVNEYRDNKHAERYDDERRREQMYQWLWEENKRLREQVALHQKSGSGTRDGSSVLNKPPLLRVDRNFGARPEQVEKDKK